MTSEAPLNDLAVVIDHGGLDEPTRFIGRAARTVWVDPDARVCARLRARFAAEIADGRLRIMQRAAAGIAASAPPGRVVEGTPHDALGGAKAIPWFDLQLAVGTPTRLLIRRAGDLTGFLRSMFVSYARAPEISLVCDDSAPVEILERLGMRSFRATRLDNPLEQDWAGKRAQSQRWITADAAAAFFASGAAGPVILDARIDKEVNS